MAIRMKKMKNIYFLFVDCVKTADGSDYAGTWNKTKSGKSCQAWSSQKPHKHGFTHLPKNHCRNPDGEPHTWCYTTDPKTRWEFCDLPQCSMFGRSCSILFFNICIVSTFKLFSFYIIFRHPKSW